MQEERTVSDIATMMQIDDAAISNMLRRMEKDGLIEKRKSKSDGRALKVKTTEYGAKLVRETIAKFHEIDKSIEKEITDKERASLHRIIKILHKHTKESYEDPTYITKPLLFRSLGANPVKLKFCNSLTPTNERVSQKNLSLSFWCHFY